MRVLSCVALSQFVALCVGSIVNTQVLRSVDASGAVVNIRYDIRYRRTDDGDSSYQFALPSQAASRLSYLRVLATNGDRIAIPPPTMTSNATLFTIPLPPAESGFTAVAAFTETLAPRPARIRQGDPQLVDLLHVGHLYYSLYPTEAQSTAVKLPSARDVSYTDKPPVQLSGVMLTLGPYQNVEPLTESDAGIRCVHNGPFAKFETLLREVDVSSWGIVSVEEFVAVVHAGAALTGGFSRVEHGNALLRPRGDTASSYFQELEALLPKNAVDIYYRDRIGNISTSRVVRGGKHTRLVLDTRYPLFGGWRSEFYVGYTTAGAQTTGPSHQLDTTSGVHTLSIPIASAFQNVWVDRSALRIILPEGAANVHVSLPTDVGTDGSTVQTASTARKTVLSNAAGSGRIVLNFESSNLVSLHGSVPGEAALVVQYSLDPFYKMSDAVLLGGAIMVALVVIVLSSSSSSSSSTASVMPS